MATLVMCALLPWRVLTTQLTSTAMYAGVLSQVSMPYDFCAAGCIEHSVRIAKTSSAGDNKCACRIGDKQQIWTSSNPL